MYIIQLHAYDNMHITNYMQLITMTTYKLFYSMDTHCRSCNEY